MDENQEMRPADAQEIRAIHLFRDMAEPQFSALIEAAYLQRFPAQVSLITEHDRPDFLHLVVEGSVEIYSKYGRRETTLRICQPVSTFFLADVVNDRPYLASGRTIEPSLILMLPAKAVRNAFDRDSAFARSVVRELARSYRGLLKNLKDQKLRTSASRLANWVLVNQTENGGNNQFRLPYDKRTLASRLGMTPENLSRNFAALAAYGVHFQGRDVVITDVAKLKAFAKPTPSIDDRTY